VIGPFPPSISASGVEKKVYWPAMHWDVEHCVHVVCLQYVCTASAPLLYKQVIAYAAIQFRA